VLAGVALAWVDTFDDMPWTIEQDEERINAAFLLLRKSVRQWPAPREFLDALKPRVQEKPIERTHRLSNDAQCETGLKHLSEIAETLRFGDEQPTNLS